MWAWQLSVIFQDIFLHVCAAHECLQGLGVQPVNYFNPLLPLSPWHAAVSLSRHPPPFHGSSFPVRLPHVTKSCSSLSHILHNQFLFCHVLSHMVLRDFWKIENIFQFRWVAWFYAVLRLFGKWKVSYSHICQMKRKTQRWVEAVFRSRGHSFASTPLRSDLHHGPENCLHLDL